MIFPSKYTFDMQILYYTIGIEKIHQLQHKNAKYHSLMKEVEANFWEIEAGKDLNKILEVFLLHWLWKVKLVLQVIIQAKEHSVITV